MDPIIVSSFVLFQVMANVLVHAAVEDSKLSRSVFFTTQANKQLQGHVVKSFDSPSLTSCCHSCLINSWCTSTNFKIPSKNNAKGSCELNKHGVIDENTKLHDQRGVTFSLLLKVSTRAISHEFQWVTKPFNAWTWWAICGSIKPDSWS